MTPIEFLTLIIDIYIVIVYANFLYDTSWFRDLHWTIVTFIYLAVTIAINFGIEYIVE